MSPLRFLLLLSIALIASPTAADQAACLTAAWPRTDFSRSLVPLDEIRPAGAARDEMPSVDAPRFVGVGAAGIPEVEPVVSVAVGGVAHAYPLRILIWHQIVNDRVAGLPVVVTYCPMCNAALVFDRRLGGEVLDFGNTGFVRRSGLVMYDRQTESWWQQYEGHAIVGRLAGADLQRVPARLESMQHFAERFPDGQVLVPSDPAFRPYGRNPFTGYDRMPSTFRYDGAMPEKVEPMARVVAVGDRAWSLGFVRGVGRVEAGDLVIEWSPGQSSALDTKHIADGRDVGNVVVRARRDGGLVDVPYSVEFAFVFKAFHPDSWIVVE